MAVRLIQVSNLSTSATKEQLRALFANVGRVEEIHVYPESEALVSTFASKIGYLRFERSEIALAALNLTGTVFLDRSIICSIVKTQQNPSQQGSTTTPSALYKIPDETEALKYCPPANSAITLIAGGATWPHYVVNRMINASNLNQQAYIETIDHSLIEKSLPQYPNLPSSTDLTKAEQIRRTVYVYDLDPRVTFENLHDLFSQIGEIKYIRLTTSKKRVDYEKLGVGVQVEDTQAEEDSIGAFIEFSEQPSVGKALCLSGLVFACRPLKIFHANQAVVVPESTQDQISIDELKKENESKTKRKEEEASKRRSSERRRERSSSRKDSRSRRRHSKSRRHRSGSQSSASSDHRSSGSTSPPPRKSSRRSRSRSKHSSSRRRPADSPPARRSSRSRSRDKHRHHRDKDKDKKKSSRHRAESEEKPSSSSHRRDSRERRKENGGSRRHDRSSSRGRHKSKERTKEKETSNKKSSSSTSVSTSRHRSKSKERDHKHKSSRSSPSKKEDKHASSSKTQQDEKAQNNGNGHKSSHKKSKKSKREDQNSSNSESSGSESSKETAAQ